MNKAQQDLLLLLHTSALCNQRELAVRSGYSLGKTNLALRQLSEEGFLDEDSKLTEKAESCLCRHAPRRAIILAAGYGMRMVPINYECPKGLLEVHGERLIERLISQLHEVGIREIYVVVGFLKERYEYLIDAFGVELIVNDKYAEKNNLFSLFLAKNHLENCYILPCDIWCAENPFRSQELYSWYMVLNQKDPDSSVRVNRKQELVTTMQQDGNRMFGICYLTSPLATTVADRLGTAVVFPKYHDAFWEAVLYEKDKLLPYARVVDSERFVEINTYEQLRELDSGSQQLKADAITTIANTFQTDEAAVKNVVVLKKGMTNRSFLFECLGKKYIMRIPGEGTDLLIDRKKEADVYRHLVGTNICDNVIYINPDTGYKITEYWENARVCDPENPKDVRDCMAALRAFHGQDFRVEHTFDVFEQIQFYESLWNGAPSLFRDYQTTKDAVFSLMDYIEMHRAPLTLTHIDAVPDNFLFIPSTQGPDEIRLIDWEYAGMQDPHIDLAMFCVYAAYDRSHVDALIDAYFTEGCPRELRIKIYCYIAVCGLLWSNWCEYKRSLGVEFGKYSFSQYRFAKEYYRIARDLMEQEVS